MPKIIKNLQEKIFESAKELFYKDGYEGVDMKAIAKKCGIAVGTLYNYYPNKDALYIEVFEKSWQSTFDKLKDLKNNKISNEDKIKKFIIIVYDDIKNRHGIGSEVEKVDKYRNNKLLDFREKIILNLIEVIQPIKKIYSFDEDKFVEKKLVYMLLANIVILIKAFPDNREENLKYLYHMLSSFMEI